MRRGKRHGIITQYYENGTISHKTEWENGKLLNSLEFFDKNGNKLDKGTLKNGNGTVNVYDELGKLIKTETYLNGELVSE